MRPSEPAESTGQLVSGLVKYVLFPLIYHRNQGRRNFQRLEILIRGPRHSGFEVRTGFHVKNPL